MKIWDLYWAPEGRRIGTVSALTAEDACRKAPLPFKKYPGEVYAQEKK